MELNRLFEEVLSESRLKEGWFNYSGKYIEDREPTKEDVRETFSNRWNTTDMSSDEVREELRYDFGEHFNEEEILDFTTN